MEQREFVESEPGSWWFIDPRSDSAWYEARRALVEPKGWQDPSWLEDQSRLLEFYKDLEAKGPQLLKELDDLYDNDDSKIRWIASVQHALAPPVEELGSEPGTGPGGEASGVEATQARAEPPAEPEAPRKKGLFAKREEAQPEPERQEPATAEASADVTAGVTQILESLSGEAGPALADELGISEDQLAELANDPEFEQMVHEEAARLQANG